MSYRHGRGRGEDSFLGEEGVRMSVAAARECRTQG